MASLQENLELLKNIATNPKKQLDHYIAAGKKVVGCFPVYTPEVMVHAAGMIPMGLWGAQTETTCLHLHVLLCSHVWNLDSMALMMVFPVS